MTKRYMDFAPKKASKKISGPQVIVSTNSPRVSHANSARMSTTGSVQSTGRTVTRLGKPVRQVVAKSTKPMGHVVKNSVRPVGQNMVGTTRASGRPVARTTMTATASKPVVRTTTTRSAVTRRTAVQSVARTTATVPQKNNKPRGGVRLGEIEDVQFADLGLSEQLLDTPTVVEQSKTPRKARNVDTYAVPRAQFINQDKVKKRPLSKNVYQKQVATNKPVKSVKETPTKKNGKPVTIISKPEKDSKVGMVVAIVLTIILGAVAGTVAFLLLPK